MNNYVVEIGYSRDGLVAATAFRFLVEAENTRAATAMTLADFEAYKQEVGVLLKKDGLEPVHRVSLLLPRERLISHIRMLKALKDTHWLH